VLIAFAIRPRQVPGPFAAAIERAAAERAKRVEVAK